VDDVWSGQRVPGSSRIRCLISGEISRMEARLLGERLSASVYQGVEFRSQGDPVLFLTNPEGVSDKTRPRNARFAKGLNEEHLASMEIRKY